MFLWYQALPLLCSGQQDALGFSADLQHLYAAVTAHGNTRKRKLSEEHLVEQDQAPTQEPDLSPSLGVSGSDQKISLSIETQSQVFTLESESSLKSVS